MKHLFYNILFITCALFFFACGAEDDPAALGGKGYLRLSVGQSNELTTKADEEYKFDRIEVFIKDSEGQTKKHTTDFEGEWKDTEIELEAGEYTIEARSYGWDGEAGEDKAYYEGSEKVTIESGKPATAEVKCYLANVKVTVAFEQAFLDALGTGSMSVQIQNKSDNATYVAKDFKAQAGKQVCYFAATDLDINYSVTNADSETNKATKELRDVKPKTHYIVTFKLPQQGQGDFTVTVDGTMTQYNCTITVDPNDASAALLTANAWAKFAYLKAESVNAGGVDISTLKFQYRVKDTKAWTDATATKETVEGADIYTGKATGLESATTYEYRLVNTDASFESTGEFTTEEATELPNGDFESWCTRSAKTALANKDTRFPCSEADYDAGNMFWDTSNRGANSMTAINPTNSETKFVASGDTAACLKTAKVLGSFLAAASLYTGEFVSATLSGLSATALIDFGRPFTSRPIALKGHYKYTPTKVEVGGELPSNATVSAGSDDQCAIYIALAKGTHRVNNTDSDTFLTLEKIEGDENIIAYGELPSGTATQGDGYVDFTIPLKYKNLTDTPTHIIVVCSASKYGDYMTGGEGSTLYVDGFSLVYDGEPEIWVKE